MIAPSTPTSTRPSNAHQVVELEMPPQATTGRSVARRLAQQVQVRALQHAVLVDVGDHVARATLRVEPGQHLVQVAALTGPAAGGQRSGRARRARRPPGRRGRDGRAHQTGVLERGGADVDAAAAGADRRGQRRVVADAAAHLHVDVEPAHDLGLQLAVVAATERRVEVDQVDPLRPASCQRSAAATGSPNRSPEPATPCTSCTAWPSAMSTAGSSSRSVAAARPTLGSARVAPRCPSELRQMSCRVAAHAAPSCGGLHRVDVDAPA